MTKRENKKKSLSLAVGETATKERRQQGGGIITETLSRDSAGKASLKRQRAAAECALDAYLLRGYLTQAQYEAGLKFRMAYLRAVLLIKVHDQGAGSQGDPGMAGLIPIYSERILQEAYAVLRKAQRQIVISVCGHDQWAGRDYKITSLRHGLDSLAKIWKLS